MIHYVKLDDRDKIVNKYSVDNSFSIISQKDTVPIHCVCFNFSMIIFEDTKNNQTT